MSGELPLQGNHLQLGGTMNTKQYMLIDNIPVEINGERNVLELIRKAGIDLPTFCYHSDLSIYGACRMCMVENERGGLDAACSTLPKAGMKIKTNTGRLRKYRRMILELLLSNHCRDCTACAQNGACKLQELARRFNIRDIRFHNTAEGKKEDPSSLCIMRDHNKCILCGDCVRMCNEVQNVGAIDFAGRGANMRIASVFDKPIAESPCVGCGQCAAVCPTGAIAVKSNVADVWAALDEAGTKVSCQIAPAVRVAVGCEFGFPNDANTIGRIIAALRLLGFDEVYDTATGADLTVLEESAEFLKRLESGADGVKWPLFTSCCPAWVQYAEKCYPELLPHLSSARSPMQMFASVIKEENKLVSNRKHVHVAIMPCTAKKFEAARDEFKADGVPWVDYVLTTQELIRMIREGGFRFADLSPEALDIPFGERSGAGVIFGVSGGVTEAVLRRVSTDKSRANLVELSYQGLRGMEGVKTTSIKYRDREVNIAVVSGLGNASQLIDKIRAGEEGCQFDFVEVMACPGGCVAGGGQPPADMAVKTERGQGLYDTDKRSTIKRSEENPLMMHIYSGILKGRVHELLHVHYKKEASHA
jgi:NADH-quinone oxidoreductase subunit G